MTRPLDKHIDSQELNALVSSGSDTGGTVQKLSVETIRLASDHVRSCPACNRRLSKYRQLVTFPSRSSAAALRGRDCPNDDIDWFEIAAGLWPSLKASQLIGHSALCDYCGPRLRAAAFLNNGEPTLEEAKFLAELKTPARPETTPLASSGWLAQRWLVRWMAPAVAIAIVVLTIITFHWIARPALHGPEFAKFAVHAHQQYAVGNVGLEVRSNSQQTLNQWLQQKLPFKVALPANPPTPGEVRPFQIEGARLIQAAGKSSAFIAYQMDTGPVSLIVTPETVAVASGGVEAKFKRVSFHYATIEGYKVVTWTLHGQSYALVAEEGNNTQKSCMVCHFAMRDRDLTSTPTPLINSAVQ